MAFGYSPVIPLQKDDIDGYYVLTKTIGQNTKQNLKNLLLTNPGERVMVPGFGVGLSRHLFEPYSGDLESDILMDIEAQVDKWMPFVEINNVRFGTQNELSGNDFSIILSIEIHYSIPSKRMSDIINISKQ